MKHYIEKQINSSFTDNSMLLGMLSSGKTYAAKQEILQDLKSQRNVFVIDMQNQYDDIKQAHRVRIDTTNDICLFEFTPRAKTDYLHELDNKEIGLFSTVAKENTVYQQEFNLFCVEKSQSLLNLFDRNLEEEERKSILRTVVQLFASIGISTHTYTKHTLFPNLADFLTLLKEEHEALYQEIAHFSDSFTARQTTLFCPTRKSTFFSPNPITIMSVQQNKFSTGEKELLLHSLLLELKRHIIRTTTLSSVVLDDISSILTKEPLILILLRMMKAAKIFNTKYLLVGQSLSYLLAQGCEHIVGSCNTFALFRQSPSEKEALIDLFVLYEEQLEELLQMPTGQALAFNSSVVAHITIPKF